MTLKVTNTKTGKVFEHKNTNHAWGDLAADMKADIVRGDTERLLTDGKTWYLLDECGNWEYLPSDYSVEGDPLSDISDLVEGRITGLDLLMATPAEMYKLDPLLKQIWAVKYSDNKPASIFAGRDGFLAIAHRSGFFDGMESGVRKENDDIIGYAKVYRKDMSKPFGVEVSLAEYNRKQGTWLTHPATMIQKVAEAQALRRAFQISGIYSPDELPEPEKPPMKEVPDTSVPESHEGMVLIKDLQLGDTWVPDKSKKKK